MNNKIKTIAGTLLLAAYLFFSLGFVSDKSALVNCRDVDIVINDSMKHRFLHLDDLQKLIQANQLSLPGTPMNEINTHHLELFFEQQPYVLSAEAYKSSHGNLTIELVQRDPMVRVINQAGNSFYIDKDGRILPISTRYTAHILVINGQIPDDIEPHSGVHITELPNASKALVDAYKLAKFVAYDDFWQSQIVQIYAAHNNEFEIIPRIGPHIIELGTVDNFQQKFKKLKVLYLKGFNNIGWNKYLRINLKYDNQIICSES
ncbi:MAG: hypothetical protein GVY19_09960 [Bacteroidetes bacterium]|jgi:cell division protein FtsQ|nr:hypothetical protein [Bacteroidota bacterium]